MKVVKYIFEEAIEHEVVSREKLEDVLGEIENIFARNMPEIFCKQ